MSDHNTVFDCMDFDWVTLDMLPQGSTQGDLAQLRLRAETAVSWGDSLTCEEQRNLVDDLLAGPTLDAAWRKTLATYIKTRCGDELAKITPCDLAALWCDCRPASLGDLLHVLDALGLPVARITDECGTEGIYVARWGADIDCGYGAHSVDCGAGQAFRECLDTINPPAVGEWSERIHMTYSKPFVVCAGHFCQVAYVVREKSVTRHPQLPSCAANHEHDWREIECCGSGAGVYMREICPRCKTIQSYDSGHQDMETGETFTAYRWEEAERPDDDLFDEVVAEERIDSDTGDRWTVLRLVRAVVDGVQWFAVQEECHDDRSYEDYQLDPGDEHDESRAREGFRDCVRTAWGKYKYRD